MSVIVIVEVTVAEPDTVDVHDGDADSDVDADGVVDAVSDGVGLAVGECVAVAVLLVDGVSGTLLLGVVVVVLVALCVFDALLDSI